MNIQPIVPLMHLWYGKLSLPYTNILRLEGDRNYTRIVLTDGRQLISSQTLCLYEAQLPKTDFIRIHKRCIVNRQYVTKILPTHLRMSDGQTVAISRRKRPLLNALLSI